MSPPLPTHRVIRGTPANLSGLGPKSGPAKFSGTAQLLAAPSGGHGANISVVP